MKKIESLTREQELELPKFRERWRKIGISTAPADRQMAESAITEMYELIDKPKPMFFWFDSPIQCNLAINFLRNFRDNLWDNLGDNLGANLRDNLGANLRANLRDNLWDNLWDNLRDNLWDNLWDNLRDNLGDNLGANLRDNLGANLRDNLRDNLWDNLGDNLWDNLRANLWDNLRANLDTNYNSDFFWGSQDSFWIAYYLFARDIIGLQYGKDDSKKLNLWADIAKSCMWWWPYENIVICCERPEFLRFNDRWRLHCQDGVAVRFRDGWEIYYWNGTEIPSEWIKEPEKLTPKTALTWRNMEQRRAACEILGWAKILDNLKAKTIDKDPDPKIGELLEVELPDLGVERFLKVQCGTGRTFALCVTKFGHSTAKECNAATYGWQPGQPLENFIPTIRT